jgi:Rad3-related DNA helicase
MSATFPPKLVLAKCLGLDTSDMDYYEIPSQFPVENRPVYCWPVVNLTSKTTDIELPKLILSIKQIVDSRPNVKILIHTTSYSLANKIILGVDSSRFIIHSNSKDKQEVIDYFIESEKPLVLVSPSCERGLSLAEDLCRVIIIAKCSFLSLGDRVTSARLYGSKIGQIWYGSNAALTIVQQAGRGVRSKEDFAETFILDEQAKNLILKNPSWFPGWFLDSIQFEKPEWFDEDDKIPF